MDKLRNDIKYYTKIRQFDRASVLLEDYLKKNPNDTYMKIYKALLNNKLGNPNESISIIEEILSTNNLKHEPGNYIFAMNQYAKALVLANNMKKAVDIYEKVIKYSDDKNEESYVSRAELARLYFNIYDRETAMNKGINILTLSNSDNKFLKVKRAKLYSFCHEYKKAVYELKKPIENNVVENVRFDNSIINQEYNYVIGYALYKLLKDEEALDYLYKAINKKTRLYFEAYLVIAKIRIRQKDYIEAMNICKTILDKDNNTEKIINKTNIILGTCYLKCGKIDEANEVYNRVTNVNGEKDYGLGRVNYYKGNFIEAEKYLEEGKKKYVEDFLDGYYFLILTKFRLNKLEEAIYYIEELEEKYKNTDKKEVKDFLNRIRQIYVYIQKDTVYVDDMDYVINQLLEYSEERAIKKTTTNHVKKEKDTKFNDNIDVRNLYNYVIDKLSKDNVYYEDLFDKYVLDIENVGYDLNNNKVNRVRVVTLPNTKKILSLHPYRAILEEKNFDVNKKKVKRLSQIDKFNQRYNK